jgi:hypothetical protein
VARRKADYPPSFRSFFSLKIFLASRYRDFCSGPTEPLYGAPATALSRATASHSYGQNQILLNLQATGLILKKEYFECNVFGIYP